MRYTPDQAKLILNATQSCLNEDLDPELKLRKLWWMLLWTRLQALTNGLRPLLHDKVYGGPFKDMSLTNAAITGSGCQAPVLLGCYEHELHPVFEKIIATNYTRILNIGCSVGYYAVGLARRMPTTIVEAFDILPEAQKNCAELAQLNHMQDRIRISGQFNGEDFARYTEGKTLVLMDIEGAETTLLDPERFPALKKMDVVVELHDLNDPTISQKVTSRFTSSHDVQIIKNHDMLPDVSALLPSTYYLDPFDHLLLGWESRDGYTPWGVYMAK
jgi:hypothetical protein